MDLWTAEEIELTGLRMYADVTADVCKQRLERYSNLFALHFGKVQHTIVMA